MIEVRLSLLHFTPDSLVLLVDSDDLVVLVVGAFGAHELLVPLTEHLQEQIVFSAHVAGGEGARVGQRVFGHHWVLEVRH